MAELAFLIAVVFAGLIVLTPVVGITVYVVTRPWLHAYRMRQQVLVLHDAMAPVDERDGARYERKGEWQ